MTSKVKRLSYLMLMFILAAVAAACAQQQPPASTPAPAGASETAKQPKQWRTPPEMTINPEKTYEAVIETTKGPITISLFAKDAPKTVNNFVFLSKEGFYDNVMFHRIIKTFMIQTGDPTATGGGGPGYKFEDELKAPYSYEPGIVAMANAGPNTNGSQFFICTQDCSHLTKSYSIFGKVKEGMETVQAIAESKLKPGTTFPAEDVSMKTIKIQEK
jgi:cyclophilin family peptidyl-prolyl cis-trans isomerase